MSITCAKCGSPLAEGQPFCTTCGARAPVPSAVETPRFCTGCGRSLSIGAKFCEKCGASAMAQPGATSPGAATPASPRLQVAQTAAPAPTSAPPAKSGGKFLKFVMIAATLFVLLLLLVMGSCAYIAYRAKQRFDKVEQAYKKDDLAGMVAAATGQTSRKPQPLPSWKPAPAELASSPSSKIPLRKSLRTINVGSDPLRGDFESIYSVDSVTDDAVHIRASQQYPSGDKLDSLLGGNSSNSQKPRTIQCGRTVFRKDMEDSANTDGYFCREGRDEKRPGTTAMSI
jgi:Double zinc ribbon